MACIWASVMSAYKVINCLISQPKYMFWVLTRTVSMRRFFEAQNYRNLLCTKILTILRSKTVFIYTMIYTVCRYDTPQ